MKERDVQILQSVESTDQVRNELNQILVYLALSTLTTKIQTSLKKKNLRLPAHTHTLQTHMKSGHVAARGRS